MAWSADSGTIISNKYWDLLKVCRNLSDSSSCYDMTQVRSAFFFSEQLYDENKSMLYQGGTLFEKEGLYFTDNCLIQYYYDYNNRNSFAHLDSSWCTSYYDYDNSISNQYLIENDTIKCNSGKFLICQESEDSLVLKNVKSGMCLLYTLSQDQQSSVNGDLKWWNRIYSFIRCSGVYFSDRNGEPNTFALHDNTINNELKISVSFKITIHGKSLVTNDFQAKKIMYYDEQTQNWQDLDYARGNEYVDELVNCIDYFEFEQKSEDKPIKWDRISDRSFFLPIRIMIFP